MGRWIRAGAVGLWLGLLLCLPVRAAPEALVPVGQTVGLELETDGVYVVQADGQAGPEGLRAGDRILAVDGQPLEGAEALCRLVRESGGAPLVLDLDRAGQPMQLALRPTETESGWQLGIRVRDRIAGLGTVTFFDPETGLFGALGHGVDSGEGCAAAIRGGQALPARVTEIRRGEAGSPGSLQGGSAGGPALGSVERNTDRGLFGHGSPEALGGEPVPLADRAEVKPGPAELWCSLSGEAPEPYAVTIEAVRLDPERCRDLRLEVTDSRLLEQTGGIVQGMSGSPILQNGKLVGAVTHVLVRDPTRGYGILIGHMLEAWETEQERAA